MACFFREEKFTGQVKQKPPAVFTLQEALLRGSLLVWCLDGDLGNERE
jgi:hypothetical protein